jgi:hypothetical protein
MYKACAEAYEQLINIYGCFRSLQAQPSMDAIDEFEEEIFDETLMFDLVCLGGGTAAGHWASTLTSTDNHSTNSATQSRLQERGLTAAIISGYPAGLPPYERSCLHTSALNPSLSAARDSSTPGCPAVDGHTAEWYEAAGSECSAAVIHAMYMPLQLQYVVISAYCYCSCHHSSDTSWSAVTSLCVLFDSV